MATSGKTTVNVTQWDSLTFSWAVHSQSVENNTSTVGWILALESGDYGKIDSNLDKYYSIVVDGKFYNGSNSIKIANNAVKTLAYGTTTIKHDDTGAKTFAYSALQSFNIDFLGTHISDAQIFGEGVLDTIPRKSTISASNGVLGELNTLTVARQSSSFTHTITYKCGSASGTICTKSSNTSVSWTPPITLAKQNTTGTSVSVTLTITTYNGDTSLGANSKTITCSIPAVVKPSVSLSVSDAVGYVDTYGVYLQGLSKLSINAQATGSQGSTLESYKITADGKTYTTASVTTDTLVKTGSQTVTVTVTDSRGRSATASKNITVGKYDMPQIRALSVFRCDADGSKNGYGAYLAVRFSSSIFALSNKNTAKYTVQYKKTSEDYYTQCTLTQLSGVYTVSDFTFVFPAETSSSYDVLVSAVDAFHAVNKTAVGSSVSQTWSARISDGKCTGLAFGKVAEFDGVFDIAWLTRHTGGVLHPTLEPGTDLDDVVIPNTYIGEDISQNNYGNCPLTSGAFTLEVVGMGDSGVKQRLTYFHKTAARAWERIYYQGGWGEWVCVSDFVGRLLWDGEYYMTAEHTATLAELVSKQKNGIVLVFSECVDGTAQNQTFHSHFVPKALVKLHGGSGHSIQLISSNAAFFATKYLYIHENRIVGHASNNTTGTGACGITYTNNRFVLRYVIGV